MTIQNLFTKKSDTSYARFYVTKNCYGLIDDLTCESDEYICVCPNMKNIEHAREVTITCDAGMICRLISKLLIVLPFSPDTVLHGFLYSMFRNTYFVI